MFNFFAEIKKCVKNYDGTGEYNLVNISGQIVYVEGHKGIVTISQNMMMFKVKNGRVIIEGKDLVLAELSDDTLKISGKIIKVEAV